MLRHQPVLAAEIFANLPKDVHTYFDGTFGHGGHVEYLLSHLSQSDSLCVVACDVDETVMQKGLAFTQQWNEQITPVLDTYAHIAQIWKKFWPFDGMLLDLGVNMEHFKDGERGFSINIDAPLDMRFSKENPVTAKEIVHTYSVEQLEKILTLYGDFSPKTAEYLAKWIVEARKKSSLETTGQLKEVLHALHCNQKKVAVIFQVLRIETNKELDQLEIFLKNFGEQVRIGGRCAIITYHSIEDRITKNVFKALAESGNFRLVHKKVIQPHYTEVQRNKAARSAKLRVIERVR